MVEAKERGGLETRGGRQIPSHFLFTDLLEIKFHTLPLPEHSAPSKVVVVVVGGGELSWFCILLTHPAISTAYFMHFIHLSFKRVTGLERRLGG